MAHKKVLGRVLGCLGAYLCAYMIGINVVVSRLSASTKVFDVKCIEFALPQLRLWIQA